MHVFVWLKLDNKWATKGRGRERGRLRRTQRGQLAGADDSVCVFVCILCLAACVCAHFHLYLFVLCLWRLCICGVWGQHLTVLPTLPPGDEDARACHCHHGYCSKRGADIACLVSPCAMEEPSQHFCQITSWTSFYSNGNNKTQQATTFTRILSVHVGLNSLFAWRQEQHHVFGCSDM